MLATTYVEIYILPVAGSLLAYQCLIVEGVHITEVVGRGACEARHGIELNGEDILVVDEAVLHNLLVLLIPSPLGGIAQGRFASLGRQELIHLRQLNRQAFFRYHLGNPMLVIDGEGFAPVALTAEDGIAQTVVHLHATQVMSLHEALCLGDGLFDGLAVQDQAFAIVHHTLVRTYG